MSGPHWDSVHPRDTPSFPSHVLSWWDPYSTFNEFILHKNALKRSKNNRRECLSPLKGVMTENIRNKNQSILVTEYSSKTNFHGQWSRWTSVVSVHFSLVLWSFAGIIATNCAMKSATHCNYGPVNKIQSVILSLTCYLPREHLVIMKSYFIVTCVEDAPHSDSMCVNCAKLPFRTQ